MQDGDVNAIAAICNFKNEIVSGKVSSDVQVGGTYDNPELTITGQLADGKISGYDINDVDANITMIDHVVDNAKITPLPMSRLPRTTAASRARRSMR